MAGSWKIRHKLMLGMGLVVVIMAFLLGGTLHGLASYRDVMGTAESKVEELREAVKLKEQIRYLLERSPMDANQANMLKEQIPKVELAHEAYRLKLKETVDRGRARNQRSEQKFVAAIQLDIQKLKQVLDNETKRPGIHVDGAHPNVLDPGNPVRAAIGDCERDVSDLIGTINDQLITRIDTTRKEARKSIMLVISTGLLAIFLMAGLLRFFYRWVAEPIRDLELGVSRVAHGDFQYRIDIKSGDEIEDLARSYNEMTEKLRDMYENLAQQVNERSRQLVRSERLAGVGFLAAGVAHEINNPLASIAFCSEALDSRLTELLRHPALKDVDKDTILKYMKMIQAEALRCGEITKKLLSFSRGGELKREQTNLAEIIQGVVDVVKHLQNSKGKQIVFKANHPILAWINSQEIKQVFLNLVVNALESMDEGGQLTITHCLRDGFAELDFKDTGCGMAPDVLENIFEPFFTRSRTGKGTGLGLSICHRIIIQHGGEIEATSDGPNKGSMFRVRLPMERPANRADNGQAVQDPEEEFLKLSSARGKPRAA